MKNIIGKGSNKDLESLFGFYKLIFITQSPEKKDVSFVAEFITINLFFLAVNRNLDIHLCGVI